MPWTVKDVWNYTKQNYSRSGGRRCSFHEIIFPVKEDATWNGNANNTLGEWEYEYTYSYRAERILMELLLIMY
jgi:hypothetical protein